MHKISSDWKSLLYCAHLLSFERPKETTVLDTIQMALDSERPYLWWWWCLGLEFPESDVAVAEVAEAEGPAEAGHGLEAEDPAAVGHCLEDLTATA